MSYIYTFLSYITKLKDVFRKICYFYVQGLEQKVNVALDAHLKRQTGEIQRLKKECREGFATVHETISHMKQVMDGKRKLLEEQIRKEIAQIRKMVVLI